MLALHEYRHRADRLADHLPWAALVGPGVVLNKDGSFQRTLAFRGPDLESATEAELVGAAARANNVLRRFGSGWALFFEAERREAIGYPDSSFPDPASWLVDEERRAGFEAGGEHFESRYFLTLVWLPPADSSDAAGRALVDLPDDSGERDWRGTLAQFVAETDRGSRTQSPGLTTLQSLIIIRPNQCYDSQLLDVSGIATTGGARSLGPRQRPHPAALSGSQRDDPGRGMTTPAASRPFAGRAEGGGRAARTPPASPWLPVS